MKLTSYEKSFMHLAEREYGIPRETGETMIRLKREDSPFLVGNGGTHPERIPGSFHYIPLSPPTVKEMIAVGMRIFRKRRKRAPRTFLEIGCGFGVVSHYAQTKCGMKAHGFDIRQKYVDASKRYLKGAFTVGDAFKFPDYHKYDIVYFYQPFCDSTLARKFNNLVADASRGIVLPLYELYNSKLDVNRMLQKGWEFRSGYDGQFFSPFDGRTKRLVANTGR